MAFLKKQAFKIAVLALCAAMGTYLLFTYVIKPEEPLPVLAPAPEFELEDIDGNAVSLESTAGKARIVYFYFANCPDVCPPTTFLLSEVQDLLREEGTLGKKAEMISITFDPERDTPEAIRSFAERLSAETNDGWHFLRPEDGESAIQLAKDFGVGVRKVEEDNSFVHFNYIMLVDQEGQIRKYINGSDEELTASKIAAELKRLY